MPKKIKHSNFFLFFCIVIVTLGISLSLQQAFADFLFKSENKGVKFGNDTTALGNGENLLWGLITPGSTGNFMLLQDSAYNDKFKLDYGGNITAAGKLEVNGQVGINADNYSQIVVSSHHDEGWRGSFFEAERSRGTFGAPTAVVNGDTMGYLDMWAYDGNSYERSAQLSASIDGAVSDGILPSKWSFSTTNSAGSRADRLVIKSDGNVGIGTASPSEKLTVNGNIFGNVMASNRNPVGLEYNILFNADNRYTVSQSGPASLSLATLFDGSLAPSYSGAAPTPSNPQIITIENLPNVHTQTGAWVGWTTRYWPMKKFKIEGYDIYAGYNNWRTLSDYSSIDYGGSQFLAPVSPNGQYTKLRFTIYEASGDGGRLGISELFFIHPEANRPYSGLMPSSVWEGSNSNVGIGTASPAAKLQVNPPASTEGLRIVLPASNPWSPLAIVNSSNQDIFRVDQSGNLTITGGVTGLSIGGWTKSGSNLYATDANDKVGIGTTAPAGKLTVKMTGAGWNDGIVIEKADTNDKYQFSFDAAGRLLLGYNSGTVMSWDDGNVGIGTIAPAGKLNINSGDLVYTNNTSYGTWRYGAKLSALAGLKGRQINNNTDFLEGISTYAVYDNGSSGSISFSLLTDDTAPNTSGRVMQIDHNTSGAPSPGWGGFYKAFSRCAGISVGQCYREGNRIMYRIWAKIPAGY
ncbi:MAG: hypothetical protein V1688_01350, partial [bacterium]